MKLGKILFTILSILLLSACKKDNIEYIDGNTAPLDGTIETVTKENYVNKLYISILGRQATDDEYNVGLQIINQNNLSTDNRKELVEVVIANTEYFHNEYETIREDILNGVDTGSVTYFKQVFIDLKETTNDSELISWYDFAIERLTLMQDIIPGLEVDTINFIEVQKRCIYNSFYDEINMGTENFVVSIYQNFLFRYPTTAELSAGSQMVNGEQATVFYTLGRTKEEFIDIFLNSNEYIEGQIRTAYLRFLFREPTTEELASMSILYKSDLNFKSMQERILISDEYVGI